MSQPVPPPPPSQPQQDVVSVMIPRNGPALFAYYMGIASLIPCLGLPVGITAVVFGIKGIKRARENPAAKGEIHAWVGIILGGLCALANLVVIGFMLFAFLITATAVHHAAPAPPSLTMPAAMGAILSAL